MDINETRDSIGKFKTAYLRPLPIVCILLVTLFVFESVLMVLFRALPPLPPYLLPLADALLLTVLAAPLFYFVIVRPMVGYVGVLEEAEGALRAAHDQLEKRVSERTENLAETNRKLTGEIAEREKISTALKESEGKYRNLSQEFRALLDAIPDSLILLSPDLRVEWANRGGAGGEGAASAGGRRCFDLCHGLPSPCEDCPALVSFRTGAAAERRIKRPDGRLFDVRTYPIMGADGGVAKVIEVSSDVTEKVRFQEETMRASHLASIGELAAGVAHEINNPVNGIINYAQMLVNRCGDETETGAVARRIMNEGDRVAVIVRGLLSFARESSLEGKEPVDLAEVLEDCLTLTRRQLEKEHILITVSREERLPAVFGHFQQLQQVFLNIINNARYALNERYTADDPQKTLHIEIAALKEGRGRRLRTVFHDQGSGIPAAVADRIFDPFFSTKPKQDGTGLGLSISHGIVSDHGGRLTCESVEGEYTRIIVDLPVVVRHGKKEEGER